MAKTVLNTAPSGQVVTTAEMKTHARIDHSDEDTLYEDLLSTAVEEVESYTWLKLLEQKWDQYFDAWKDPLVLDFGPLSGLSIDEITYTDEAGDSQTLDTSIYELGEVDEVPVVRRKYNQDWPTVRAHQDVIKVTYTVGYGTADDVPEKIKQAIRLHCAWDIRNREGDVIPMPKNFRRLLSSFRLATWQPTT